MSHDRTIFHRGVDSDTAVELAESIEGLDASELHAVLAEIDARLAFLEGQPRFSLDAVIA